MGLVRERYPAWGEEILLGADIGLSPLHLRLSMPAEPAAAPACILIVHGMNEYVGRYAAVAEHLTQRFIVAGVDLRAHGLTNPTLLAADRAIASGVQAVDVGKAYLAQAELGSLDPMRKDLAYALRYLVAHCDRLTATRRPPVFVISHSLGSLVTASYLLPPYRHDDPRQRVQGVIFSGPAFSVTKVPGWRGWLQNPLINLSFYTRKHFLTPHDEPLPLLLANQLLALVTVPLLEGVFEVLSWPGLRRLFSPRAPDWVGDYMSNWETEKVRRRQDNYIIRRSMLRYVKAVEGEIIRFRRIMHRFATPYLLIYSPEDPITPAWGSRDFAALTLHRHADSRLLPLPGESHHEHFFSTPPLRKRLLETIDQWLECRLQALQGA